MTSSFDLSQRRTIEDINRRIRLVEAGTGGAGGGPGGSALIDGGTASVSGSTILDGGTA